MATHRPTPPPIQSVAPAAEPLRRSTAGGRIAMKVLSRFCHNVGTGLHAGVDVRRIFENEAIRGSARHRSNVMQIRDDISKGCEVSEAFRGTNGYFPLLVCEMVEVGERTGRLEQAFIRMGEYYEHLLKLRRTFLMGIAWPLIEMTLAICVIGLFILIIGMVHSDPNTPPPMTFFGLYGPVGAAIYFGTVFLIVGSMGGAIYAASRGWINLDPLYRVFMMLPFLGSGLKTVAMARLTWALAMATDSDLGADRAIELAIRTSGTSYYTRFIEGMKNSLRRGRTIYEAFAATAAFPEDFLAALHTGEIAGTISETMHILSREYEDRTKLFFRTLTVVAGVLVFLMVAGIIVFMIFTMAMQYIGILNEATKI